jgi:hypothetical protein
MLMRWVLGKPAMEGINGRKASPFVKTSGLLVLLHYLSPHNLCVFEPARHILRTQNAHRGTHENAYGSIEGDFLLEVERQRKSIA